MTDIRAMVVMTGGSGLAEDRCVNTFYFSNGLVSYAEHMETCRVALVDFYTGVGTGTFTQTFTLGSYISPWINRLAEIRFYNMADAKPRVPTIYSLPLGSPTSAVGLPEEVALVLTLQGAPPVTRRRRGRIYLGPLYNGAAFPSSGTSAPTRPDIAFTNNVVKAAYTMINTPALGWCIHSMVPTENYVNIVGGYVDNAFDTQRRRGPDASTRVLITE